MEAHGALWKLGGRAPCPLCVASGRRGGIDLARRLSQLIMYAIMDDLNFDWLNGDYASDYGIPEPSNSGILRAQLPSKYSLPDGDIAGMVRICTCCFIPNKRDRALQDLGRYACVRCGRKTGSTVILMSLCIGVWADP